MSSKNVWLYENRINTRELVDILKLGKEINKPICVLSASGVGKTEIVQQFAEKEYKGVCHTIILSHYDQVDLVGQSIPFIEGGKVYMKLSESALVPMDKDFVGVLFLDEITNINQSMAHCLYQLVNERKLAGRDLPKGMQIVLAGNRTFDNGASQDLLGPLANRLIICELEPNPLHWLEDYAPKVNIHPAIVRYIYDNPEELYEYGSLTDCPSFASGRSMKTASDILWNFQEGGCNMSVVGCAINGCIGDNKWYKIYPIYESVVKLPSALDILENKCNKFDISEVGMAGIFTVITGCLYYINSELSSKKSDNKAIEYGKNFIEFMANSLSEEKEIIVSQVNKLFNMGKDSGNPAFIMEIRKNNPSFILLLKDNIEFEQQISKLIQ